MDPSSSWRLIAPLISKLTFSNEPGLASVVFLRVIT
jgi:hypothetical protein